MINCTLYSVHCFREPNPVGLVILKTYWAYQGINMLSAAVVGSIVLHFKYGFKAMAAKWLVANLASDEGG